jgi:hypothetical protein
MQHIQLSLALLQVCETYLKMSIMKDKLAKVSIKNFNKIYARFGYIAKAFLRSVKLYYYELM